MARLSGSQMKFVKVLSRFDSVVDSLEMPPKFCREYGHKLSELLKLSVGDVFEASIKYNRHSEVLIGMKKVYDSFKLKGGESLVFEFSSLKRVRLSIIDTNEMEVFYPKLIFPNGAALCPLDRACKWGLKYVKFLTCMKKSVDSIVAPDSFVDAFGSVLRHDLTYCLVDGREVCGFYDCNKNKLVGFGEICKAYGVADLSCFDMMVLTYDGRRKIYVSLFDTNHVEVVPPRPEGMKFEVMIKPFHLYDYCYGVDIPTKYRVVTDKFGQDDYIRVFRGEEFWMLQIRKRNDLKRTTIHDGWLQFKTDLKLAVGDTCVFHKLVGEENFFKLQVVKSGGN